jgi:hypothetical protein
MAQKILKKNRVAVRYRFSWDNFHLRSLHYDRTRAGCGEDSETEGF